MFIHLVSPINFGAWENSHIESCILSSQTVLWGRREFQTRLGQTWKSYSKNKDCYMNNVRLEQISCPLTTIFILFSIEYQGIVAWGPFVCFSLRKYSFPMMCRSKLLFHSLLHLCLLPERFRKLCEVQGLLDPCVLSSLISPYLGSRAGEP